MTWHCIVVFHIVTLTLHEAVTHRKWTHKFDSYEIAGRVPQILPFKV